MAESGVPIVCTLHPNELGGRLEEWHRLLTAHLAGIERPAPTRLLTDCSCGLASPLPALEPPGPAATTAEPAGGVKMLTAASTRFRRARSSPG